MKQHISLNIYIRQKILRTEISIYIFSIFSVFNLNRKGKQDLQAEMLQDDSASTSFCL